MAYVPHSQAFTMQARRDARVKALIFAAAALENANLTNPVEREQADVQAGLLREQAERMKNPTPNVAES